MVKLSQFSRGELEILKSMNLQCQLGARYCYASVFVFLFFFSKCILQMFQPTNNDIISNSNVMYLVYIFQLSLNFLFF